MPFCFRLTIILSDIKLDSNSAHEMIDHQFEINQIKIWKPQSNSKHLKRHNQKKTSEHDDAVVCTKE
jgi:hypothetical protein